MLKQPIKFVKGPEAQAIRRVPVTLHHRTNGTVVVEADGWWLCVIHPEEGITLCTHLPSDWPCVDEENARRLKVVDGGCGRREPS